ncbi:MAG: DUF2279 domain-containing protein [Candidatus Competibacteraceae bacterium]|nr:DUF2279 domain-containing protein [Candidatus Competibacteraceae bacterium]
MFIKFYSITAQTDTTTSVVIKTPRWRLPFVLSTGASVFAGSITGLNYLWYEGYPRSSFHVFNDNHEWMGMDKAGHAYTAYVSGAICSDLLRWAGVKRKTAIWTGGTAGFVYLSAIEILDGFSEQWGFSWGDMIANASGSALYITQQLLWDEQRFQFKFSYWPSEYPKQRPELLGSNFAENILKDYNAQTYWLSCNIWSFLPNRNQRKFPKWLNVSVGYGANGMLGGAFNPIPFEHIQRYHQFYLSLDLDLTKIPTRSKAVRTLLKTLNYIKFPAPTLEFTTHPDYPVRFHWLMF